MSEEIPPTNHRSHVVHNAPGVLNALLLGASVIVILGIYGYSIYRTSTVGEELVLTAPRSAEASIEPAVKSDEEALSESDEGAPSETKGTDQAEDDPGMSLTDPDPGESPVEEKTYLAAVVETPEPETTQENDDTAEVPVEVAVVDEEEFLERGWKFEASDLLQGFLSATTVEQQARFLNDAERVAPLLNSIHQQPGKPWDGLTVNDFKHIDLSEADRRKGIFLMLRETSGEDSNGPADRSYAFFKRSEDGLKLDLEVFLQTTGNAFGNFVNMARPGTSQVFRVFITEDPASPPSPDANFRTYIIAGLANFKSPARVRVTDVSPIGQILGATHFKSEDGSRQVMRNATVELRWTDQPDHSVIELSRFICWEFLGLGGEPIDDPVAPQW
jgi:hypothetical protein